MANPAQVKLRRGDVLGLRFLAKAHTSHKCPSMQSQIALFPIPMLHSMLQNQVRHSRAQLTAHISLTSDRNLRILSNPVILSNTAKLVADSGCFDHCCPLEFATQFELKEGRFLNASAANTIKLKHYGTRVVEGWRRDVNGTEIPLKIKFNVFDVKSPFLSTSKLRKHGYSVFLDQQQTIQKNGTTIALTDQNGLPTLELRLARRTREVDEKMCAPVEEIGEEARRATPLYVPRGPSDAKRRAHEIHHMPYRSWCEYCVRGRGKESPHLSRYEQGNDIPVVQVDYAFLHDTGDKEAKVTFLTMVDNSSGQMVATAVQKKGHDKFVERFLLKGLESFGVTGEMVVQTDKETEPIDVARHLAAERKATTIIRQTPKKSSQSNAYVERAHQSVEAMVGTMKEVIEDKAHTRLSATDNITSWMIRHAAFLQTRFSVGKDGKTPFKRRHHKDYTSQLLPFGSAVDAKIRDEDTERSKFDSRFIPSIWLGRATERDEHVVGTAQVVYTLQGLPERRMTRTFGTVV